MTIKPDLDTGFGTSGHTLMDAPIPPTTPEDAAAATRAVVAWAVRHHAPLSDVAQLLDALGLDGLAREAGAS